MNKILVSALILFSVFIISGVHVANSHSENDNLSQTVTRPVKDHHVNSQSSSGTSASHFHVTNDHRIETNR